MSKDCITSGKTADPRPRTVFGIDSHSRTTTICALEAETGEATTRTFRGNDYEAMSKWMAKFPAPARGVYEAGCTGFVPARLLTTDDAARSDTMAPRNAS